VVSKRPLARNDMQIPGLHRRRCARFPGIRREPPRQFHANLKSILRPRADIVPADYTMQAPCHTRRSAPREIFRHDVAEAELFPASTLDRPYARRVHPESAVAPMRIAIGRQAFASAIIER
jgi:hypothetical protein